MLYAGMTEHQMNLFKKGLFEQDSAADLSASWSAAVIMKGLSIHNDFSWATALAAEQENSRDGLCGMQWSCLFA
jgi:hypothetical protein